MDPYYFALIFDQNQIFVIKSYLISFFCLVLFLCKQLVLTKQKQLLNQQQLNKIEQIENKLNHNCF
jgi:hypothetical protein